MRGHFEYELFNMPSFPPGFGPWGRGFGPCGRGRPQFGMPGWPNFDRHGCRPCGPPGFRYSPHRHGPCQEQECGENEHHEKEDQGHSDNEHQRTDDRQESFGCRRSRCRKSPECGRREPTDNCQGPSRRGRCDWSPQRESPGHGHNYCRFGPGHHGFGRASCPRDIFGWPGFGPGHRWPHFGSRFDHRRSGPYDRPGHSMRSCRNMPCCSGNKENRGCRGNEAGRKENRPCGRRDQNETGDTVLVQRIVVEKAPARPLSV